ncbi:MAG: serine/threonine-protein kinase [Polyangiaceae bacterium]
MNFPLDVRARALRDALVGQPIAGTRGVTYYLGDVFAEGGQGFIYSARWGDPGGFAVAVKVLRPDTFSREALVRFEREASVLRMLAEGHAANPHIVRIFDNGTHDVTVDGVTTSMPFTVLEHVRGDSLDAILRATSARGMPVARVLRIVDHVASALSHVHQHGVVHRDLKPSNVLLTPTDEGEVAKVTDFGLAKLVQFGPASTHALAGASLGYAPPEQYERGNERVTARSDVFSLAAIVFEMLSGERAFPFGSDENALVIVTRLANGPRPELRKFADKLSYELRSRKDDVQRLEKILKKALRTDPEERHETVAAFARDVGDVLRPIVSELSAQVSNKGLTGRAVGVNVPMSSANPTPSQVWSFQVSAAHAPPESLRAAFFDPSGQRALATSVGGLLHWEEGRWRVIPWPRRIDGRSVRGIAPLPGGDLLVFGERAMVLRWSPSGDLAPLGTPDRAVTFTAATALANRVTLVGYRGVSGASGSPDAVGVLLEIANDVPRYMFDLPGTTRLRAVSHLADGTAVVVGDWGALARVKDGHVYSTSSVCGGHLNASATLAGDVVVVVGAGGHALTLPSIGTPVLEAVETTKDLRCLALTPSGVAFAGGRESRIVTRRGGRWVRLPFQMDVDRAVIALHAEEVVLRALCDDGTVVVGTRHT